MIKPKMIKGGVRASALGDLAIERCQPPDQLERCGF
jgi:hypothetical protein